MRALALISIIVCFFSCSKKIIKPSYIVFDQVSDSLHIIAKNKLKSPYHIRIEKEQKVVSDTIVVFPNSNARIMSFSEKEMDSTTFLKHYHFKTYLGILETQSYDTLYNYSLPFPKNKSYQILQGNNGSYSHHGSFSRYSLDFKMPVGDTICAARSGYVVSIVKHNTKQGNDKSFIKYANFIILYHDDGTYSQYVHLKKDGVFVALNQYVEKGEAIGLSGHTGWSTQPHLHFAVFKVKPFEFISIPIIINGEQSLLLKRGDLMSHKTKKGSP